MKKIKGYNLKKIVYLDGIRLRNAILSSLALIKKKKNYLNKINFFPIPDKDAGTNLFHTLNFIVSELYFLEDRSITLMSHQLSKSALSAAQGYSGTILAQFFQGFARGFSEQVRISTVDFALASQKASKAAYASLSEPIEGTILSVMRDWANSVSKIAEQTDDFVELLNMSLQEAKQSLAETKKILPVLKKAGVVDAGAQGFIFLLDGILNFIKKGNLKDLRTLSRHNKPSRGHKSEKKIHDYSGAQPVDEFGIVTDSSCDLPDHYLKNYKIHVIPLKIIFGSETFLDKVQITPTEFYNKLIKSPTHPKTSQPALADVTRLFDEIVPKYNHILSIHLPLAISGTLSVVEKAAQKYGKKITCIDGKNISAALGLVTMEAVYAIEKGLSREKVINRIEQSIENIKIFIVLPTVKYLVKGGRLSKSKGFIGRLLRLNPILAFDTQGQIVPLSKAFGNKTALKKAFKIAQRAVKDYKRIKFMIAHADAPVKARWVSVKLSRLFQLQEKIEIVEVAPVLGVHVGPGTVGFGFIGYHQ